MTTTQRPEELLDTVELTGRERQKLLGVQRPRLVIEVLAAERGPIALDTLAREVARREDDVTAADERATKHVAKSLRYDHLPNLADAGVLTYDPEANLVEPTTRQSA